MASIELQAPIWLVVPNGFWSEATLPALGGHFCGGLEGPLKRSTPQQGAPKSPILRWGGLPKRQKKARRNPSGPQEFLLVLKRPDGSFRVYLEAHGT